MRLFDLLENYTADTIIANGKERSATNSNGERIATTRAGLLNFYRWFGNSKVVDRSGRPLVMYHGTKHHKQPKIMEPSYKKRPLKIHLRTDKDIASDDETTSLMDLFKQRKKVKGPDTFGYNQNQAGMYFTPSEHYASNYGKASSYYLRIETPMYPKGINDYLSFLSKGDVDIIKNQLHKDGYIDKHGNGEYIVFDSNQIKKVDNIGSFSTKSKLVTK